jgi:hypothetical protein
MGSIDIIQFHFMEIQFNFTQWKGAPAGAPYSSNRYFPIALTEGGWGLSPRVEFARPATMGANRPSGTGDGGLGPQRSRRQEFLRAAKATAP